MSGIQQVESVLDIQKIRDDFPVLHQQVNGKPLVYLDNAATTQKPLPVIKAIENYYRFDNANIHRGIHTLAEKATAAFEETRTAVQEFINAESEQQVVFTRGTTDSINLVASSYGSHFLSQGDEIILTGMEHHSNIVPWQLLAERTGAIIKVIPVDEHGVLDLEVFHQLLSERTRMVSVVYASNTLGTINPVKDIITDAHQEGAVVLLDGAQASSHLPIDVQALNVDFFAFSAHKMYGPTGVGVLYGKRELLEKMPPYQGGGEMIKEVSFTRTTYNDIPFKFEAGTPNIADIIAFKAAIDYVNRIGKPLIIKHETELLEYATKQIGEVPGVRLVGTSSDKVSVVSFIMEGVHHFDIGMMLDARGVAVRTGHHCTQPLMDQYGIEGTARASFAVYNTLEEIDILTEGLNRIAKMKR